MSEQVPSEVVVITGLSGAGRSTAANALEDLGFFVIDNMPASLITRVLELAATESQRICFGCDVRSREFFDELGNALNEIDERFGHASVVFCEASDDVLLRRFEESRRPHPLAENDGVAAGIRRERAMLEALKERADLIIDTSDMNVHELRERVRTFFSTPGGATTLKVAVQSFGFKHGPPRDADLVFDVRFLPNPHWVEALRPLPGTSDEVTGYVLGQPDAEHFVELVNGLLDFLLPLYLKEGKSYLTIAIGCTGGRHRSVVLADCFGAHVHDAGYPVVVTHRDLDV